MTTFALTHESINAQGGLPLIGTPLEKFSGLRRAFGSDPARRSDRLSDADILISQLGLIVQCIECLAFFLGIFSLQSAH